MKYQTIAKVRALNFFVSRKWCCNLILTLNTRWFWLCCHSKITSLVFKDSSYGTIEMVWGTASPGWRICGLLDLRGNIGISQEILGCNHACLSRSKGSGQYEHTRAAQTQIKTKVSLWKRSHVCIII